MLTGITCMRLYTTINIFQQFVMFVYEEKLFKPIYDKVLVPAIENDYSDVQTVVESSSAKTSQFKLKNPKHLEKELERDELKKYIKHIRRVKRYIKQKIKQMEETVPGSKVDQIAKQIQEAEEEINCPEIDR